MKTDTNHQSTAVQKDEMPIPRGSIKKYRVHLNAENAVDGHKWKNRPGQGQRKQLYGDYLYAQDCEMFMVNLREWMATQS